MMTVNFPLRLIASNALLETKRVRENGQFSSNLNIKFIFPIKISELLV